MISVLVCAPDDLVGHQLAQILGSGTTRVVGVAVSSTTALRRLAEDLDVDVVVVDDRIAPVPVWQLVRTLGSTHPGAAVVVTVADAGPEVFAEAMDAGARGVVARPVAVEDLLGRVAAASAWSASVRRLMTEVARAGALPARAGSMTVLCGAKGGVGTTTLAVHLALGAAAAGRSTVLVDLDLAKGDVASVLDVAHQRDVTDLLGVTEELSDRALVDVLYQHRTGLRVLLAPRHGERAEEVTTASARLVLASLSTRFEVVVVDAGSRVDEAGSAAVEMADAVLLVATPDLAALSGVRRSVGVWERLGVLPSRGLGVVVSRLSRRSDVQVGTAARVVGVPLARASIAEDPAGLQEAVNRRDPTLVPRRFTADVAALAAELGIGVRAALSAPTAPATPAPSATGRPGRSGGARRGSRGREQESDLAALVAGPGAGGPPLGQAPLPQAPLPALPTTGPPAVAVRAGDPAAHRARAAGQEALDSAAATLIAHPAPPAPKPAPARAAPDGPDAGPTALERRLGLDRADAGQATLEFVGIMPLLLLLVLLVWQGVVVGVTWSSAGHAAAEGASAASVGGDPGAAARTGLPAAWRDGAAVTGGVRGVRGVLQNAALLPGAADLGLSITVTSAPVSEL